MINWLMNLIGVLVYFINRYANRRNKTKFRAKYWLNDNWPELSSTLLINIALMFLLIQPETNINIDDFIKQNVPFELHIAIKPLFSLLLGLGLSAFLYRIFKSKVKR